MLTQKQIYDKQYREKNKEKRRLQSLEYKRLNKDKIAQQSKEYAAKNKDRISGYQKEWYLINREKESFLEKRELWKINNKDRLIEYHKRYNIINRERHHLNYIKNKDHIAKLTAIYRKNNREKLKIWRHKYRALKKGSNGVLSKGIADKLYSLQKGRCICCGLRLGKDYHIDHIMPLSKGGTNTDDNVQLLRAFCNRQKNSKDPFEFMQSRGFLF